MRVVFASQEVADRHADPGRLVFRSRWLLEIKLLRVSTSRRGKGTEKSAGDVPLEAAPDFRGNLKPRRTAAFGSTQIPPGQNPWTLTDQELPETQIPLRRRQYETTGWTRHGPANSWYDLSAVPIP